MRKPRIVLDTSALISVFFSKGRNYVHDILDLIAEGELEAFVCNETINELLLVMQRSKNNPSVKEPNGLMLSYLQNYLDVCQVVEDIDVVSICRDKGDDKFLSLSKKANADYLITIDKDLLVLESFQGTKVCRPGEFLEDWDADR